MQNDENCFFNDDVVAINDLINLNSMSYESPLDIGIQTWVSSRLVSWVATYTPTGNNGVNEKIASLPLSIGNLTNLYALLLDYNQLTSLPESFSNLINLQDLYLDDNELTSLPENFKDLTNLSMLRLENNQLTSLPEGFETLNNLRFCYMSDNNLILNI